MVKDHFLAAELSTCRILFSNIRPAISRHPTAGHPIMVDVCKKLCEIKHRMSCVVHYFLLLLPTALSYVVSGRELPDISWTTKNSMFQSSNNDHIIDVNLGDRLKIICPHYTDGKMPMSQWEYYLIYMVDSYNYEVCVINDTSNKIPILNCSNPEVSKFFTLLILEFQPIPGIPDFELGFNYYFISTSGGRKFNINNQYEGACKEHQMKMMLRVRSKTASIDNNTPGPNLFDKSNQPTPQLKPSTSVITTTLSTTTTTITETAKPTTRRPSNISRTEKPGDGDTVPGSDGFPDDETVIHAGEGPNINSGIIADNGMESSGISIHNHRHSVQYLYVIASLSLLISAVLLRR